VPIAARRSLAALLLAAVAGCSGGGDASPPIILVTFDTTRVDHLSAYGYGRQTTPNLDAMIASRGVRFDEMTAASNNTSCSFATVHSGVYVKSHGVIKLSPFGYPLDPAFKTIGEVLGSRYFRVAAVGAAHLNGEVSGLGRGFDKFFEHPPDPNEIKKPCERTNGELIPFLKETFGAKGEKRPLFLWLHYFDPHWPYEPPAPFDTAFAPDGAPAPPAPSPPEGFSVDDLDRDLRESRSKYVALYDGEIRRTDSAMGEVLKTLDALGILEKAIVVFTADHGENLGEHDLYFNHLGIYQPVVHVPLIVRLPNMTEPKTSDALVHHVDILPTILDAANVPKSQWPPNEGTSLTDVLRGRATAHHADVYTEAAHYREKAVRDARWKLIVDGSLQKLSLYDLEKDPGETKNLEATEAKRAGELLSKLEEFVGSRDFRFHAVAAADAPAATPYALRIRTRKEIAPLERSQFDGTDATAAASKKDQSARFAVEPGANKGVKATVPYGALFLDAWSTAAPIDSNEVWLGGKKPQKDTSTPLVFAPGEEGEFPEKAPSTRPGVVRVEEVSRDAESARYRFTLGPVAPGVGKSIVLRAGTDGVLSDAKRLAGELHYAGFDVPDRFRIMSLDATIDAAFEITVKPGTASFFIEGKLDERRLSNTEYRRGPAGPGDDRRYPTTFFVSPNGLGPPMPPQRVATELLAKPGFHMWIDLRPGERGSGGDASLTAEEQALLEALGYAGGGAGGRGAAKKKEKPAPPSGEDPGITSPK